MGQPVCRVDREQEQEAEWGKENEKAEAVNPEPENLCVSCQEAEEEPEEAPRLDQQVPELAERKKPV